MFMRLHHLLPFIGFSVVFGAGCVHGSYRVVKKVPSAGELALVGPQEEARQKAEGYMKDQCPQGFDILEEGEAVIGQNSTSQTNVQRGWLGPQANSSSSTEDKREWRIKYQCKGAGPAPAAPGAAPAAATPQAKIHELVIVF